MIELLDPHIGGAPAPQPAPFGGVKTSNYGAGEQGFAHIPAKTA